MMTKYRSDRIYELNALNLNQIKSNAEDKEISINSNQLNGYYAIQKYVQINLCLNLIVVIDIAV